MRTFAIKLRCPGRSRKRISESTATVFARDVGEIHAAFLGYDAAREMDKTKLRATRRVSENTPIAEAVHGQVRVIRAELIEEVPPDQDPAICGE